MYIYIFHWQRRLQNFKSWGKWAKQTFEGVKVVCSQCSCALSTFAQEQTRQGERGRILDGGLSPSPVAPLFIDTCINASSWLKHSDATDKSNGLCHRGYWQDYFRKWRKFIPNEGFRVSRNNSNAVPCLNPQYCVRWCDYDDISTATQGWRPDLPYRGPAFTDGTMVLYSHLALPLGRPVNHFT